jgi:hypothetical protein
VTGATGVAVTLTGVNTFMNNGTATTGSGLVILSDGQITLNNVTATGNKASGASLNNTYASLLVTKPGIKLTRVNNFNQNLSNGLNIISFGLVDLVNVTAGLNGADGLHATTSGKFTLACSSLNNNGAHGWDVTAGGLIALKGVFGFGNPSGNNPVSPLASVFIIRGCPAPVAVVIPPKDDSDEEEHGSNKKLVYVKLDEYLRK